MSLYNEVEQLTINLVRIPSVNNTDGERLLADKITEYIKNIDYFKHHPQYVWELPLKSDRFGRKNVIALLKGEKSPSSPTTVILHGHIDTVGVEDFGLLSEFAFDPILLEQKLKEVKLPDDVKKDLDSGEWLFGRGAVDMKSGLAAHLVVLKEMSKKVQDLTGNILFMANPVEENQHTGIIESLTFLKELKQSEGLIYRLAINNDYTSPLYPGDPKRYVYLGAVGKLLPCFYIVGKETHVGQCFEGLDPNLIAAELLRLININSDLCDEYDGEYSLPPAALKMTDLKASYNVQTPVASYLYFNYFTHNLSVQKLLEILQKKTETAINNVTCYLDTQYQSYCQKTGLDYAKINWAPRVTTYDELYKQVKNKLGEKLDRHIGKIAEKLMSEGTDTRIICLRVVEEIHKLSKDTGSLVVIYFSPPYCPHNTIKGKTIRDKLIFGLIEELIDEAAQSTGEVFEIRKFFPSLSDSSYLTMDDDDISINSLVNNFPEWDTVYPVPVREIRQTNIPAVNFGSYGKDAHKWSERVHKPYTFSILPRMTMRAIEKLFATRDWGD